MRTLEEIQKMLEDSGSSILRIGREIRKLSWIIESEEVISYATSGFCNNCGYFIVVTNKRIIFLSKAMFFCWRKCKKDKEMRLDKVNTINYKKGFIWAKIEIWDGVSITDIKYISKDKLLPFINTLNEARERIKKEEKIASVADELMKFKVLLDIGAVTQEEYADRKKRLLK